MKGTASAPRCGFSNQMVQLLTRHTSNFSTFDILTDEAVRQGLKTYSNWPTYPQLYINGELVGGLDIAKELDQSGELANLVPAAQPASAPEAAAATTAPVSEEKPKHDDAEVLNKRLHDLVNMAPIMIFMKGSPSAPRCGFSSRAVEMLKKYNVTFGHFDILSDETVRQGLKTYSNWQTYPQLYVKGELIGGLDIMNELDAQGELKDVLTQIDE